MSTGRASAGLGPGPLVEAAIGVPLETIAIEPWRAGISGGFTRRANSVLPLGEPADLGASLRRARHHGGRRARGGRIPGPGVRLGP